MTFTHRRIVIALTLSVLLLPGCIERKAETQSKKESPVSAELNAMLEEYQNVRNWKDYPPALLAESDLRHRQTVYQLLAQALIVEAVDLYHAAILLQTPDSGASPVDQMLAYYCALEASRKGYTDARRLSAEYLDKHLVASGLPQKYGTQKYQDSTGKYLLHPFDPNTSDQERAAWGIPPLESLKAMSDNE